MPDLSPKMIESLRNLAAAGGRVSGYGVAMTRARIGSHSIDALTRRGLVESQPSEDDYYEYVITEAGRRALAEVEST